MSFLLESRIIILPVLGTRYHTASGQPCFRKSFFHLVLPVLVRIQGIFVSCGNHKNATPSVSSLQFSLLTIVMVESSCIRGHSSLFLVILLAQGHLVTPKHFYTDSFPTNDEFDYKILDPNNIYGSPYGGFSRATRSRLASLPLPLPSSDTTEVPLYLQVSDGDGRKYACRVYHEDELATSSLTDSMFDTVKLKGSEGDTNSSNDPQDGDNEIMNELEVNTGVVDVNDALVPGDDTDTTVATSGLKVSELMTSSDKSEKTTDSSIPATVPEGKVSVQTMTSILTKLAGICTLIHKGWWSYEWCHGDKITQFHVHMDEFTLLFGKGRLPVEDFTMLGNFKGRMFAIVSQDNKGEADTEPDQKAGVKEDNDDEGVFKDEYASGEVEIGKVTDSFENGDICPQTNKPRRASVHYRCCSIETMDAFQSGVLHRGKPIRSNIAAVIGLEETAVCYYMVTVCTPLLCKGLADQYENGVYKANAIKIPLEHPSPTRPPRKENESIRETLNRTLSNVCLQKSSNDWWAYKLCHGKTIQQYHEDSFPDPSTGLISKVVDSTNILGVYDLDGFEGFPNDKEVDYVVNATDDTSYPDLGSMMSKGNAITQRGNGAYFKQEYIRGDDCEGKEASEATIKAGNVRGVLKRATTVRYFCGPRFEVIEVNEDSKCHYIMDVTIPDLCQHPLFKAMVSKKQVMKCLPVN